MRADGEPRLDRIPQGDLEEVPPAEVTRRRHARGKELPAVLRHPQQQARVALAAPPGDGIDGPVAAKVHMRVDQSWQQRAAGQVDDLGPGDFRGAAPGTGVHDPRPVDQDLAVHEALAGPAGQHQVGTEQLHDSAVDQQIAAINVRRRNATRFLHLRGGQPATRMCRLRGPWTPSTRISSMSLVADGPEISVCGRAGSSRAIASAMSAATWSARTTTRWKSGTRVSARRPWPGPWSSTIVPVSAIATAQPVTTPKIPSSSRADSGGSSRTILSAPEPGSSASHSGGRPSGTTNRNITASTSATAPATPSG